MKQRIKATIQSLFSQAGITINGSNPWDIVVHDERFYSRILSQGSLGFGEAYMDSWWDAKMPDELCARILKAHLEEKVGMNWKVGLQAVAARLLNMQSRRKAFEIGRAHYDIGNDLYRAMLDARMTYTCGYWNSPAGEAYTLDEAQEHKLDLVCKKIGLKSGDRVLDIGCGWGSFAKFAAERYGASVVGITVSKAQLELGQKMCEGLPIELRLQDYRALKDDPFDHIVSLGMFEHVGYKNYRTYMEVARRLLKPGGLFLLHTIGGNTSVKNTDPWIEKYIFPNSMLPSIAQISAAIEGLFVMEDWHNFASDYDRTLMEWYGNVQAYWNELKTKYGERFHRMWNYYLLASAATFRARQSQLWQVILSPSGVPGGYTSIR